MTEAKASSDEANAGDGPALATPLSSSVATEKPPSTDRGDGLGKKDSSDEAAPAPASSDGQSFSQLLGTVSKPAASPRPAAIVTVPVVAVPYFISPASLVEPQGIAVQFAMTHQAALATVTAQAQMQLQAACTSSSNSMTTMLSTVSPTPLQQMPPPTPKKTFGDLYNWRKYGQKQVKSSENARSYYRCTNTNCSAKKKVEHCPDGTVVEVIYAGKHNHDPPQKHRYIRDRGTQPGSSLSENESLERVNTESDKSDPSVSKTDQNSNNGIPKQPLYCSSDCEFDAATKSEEDMDDEPKTKRRPIENSKSSSVPVLKTVKEYIVQTEIDARHLSDGYRWRKYGQKFVKGNSNPRSYYRCTYGGCPVRKHVERASHDAKALLITYEGEHNHDQPNSNFSGDSPLAALKTNVTAGMTDEKLSRSTESLKKASCKSHSNSAVEEGEGDGEHEHEGDQVLESAQALLSMGFSSTSGETAPRSSSEGLKSPILNETPGAVSVQNT